MGTKKKKTKKKTATAKPKAKKTPKARPKVKAKKAKRTGAKTRPAGKEKKGPSLKAKENNARIEEEMEVQAEIKALEAEELALEEAARAEEEAVALALEEAEREKGIIDTEEPYVDEETEPVNEGDVSAPFDDTGNEVQPSEEGLPETREEVEVVKFRPLVELLVFNLVNEFYAFRLSDLQEVLKDQILTRVPKMPSFIIGLTSLRGKIIPVMDLNGRLEIKGERETGKKQIAIIKGTRGPIGMVIDKVVGVKRVEEDDIMEPPSHLDDDQIRFIDSVVNVGNRFISIIKISEVLDFEPLPL
ncbi:MAG: purine-binding chemotaxis protein CheW [Nitrospirota bacterium]|nr:MAG: purine-binding chemotaxis protein CheW [Nitrospirota bacterium]